MYWLVGPVNIVFTGLYVWVVPVTSGNLYCTSSTNYLSTGNRYRLYIESPVRVRGIRNRQFFQISYSPLFLPGSFQSDEGFFFVFFLKNLRFVFLMEINKVALIQKISTCHVLCCIFNIGARLAIDRPDRFERTCSRNPEFLKIRLGRPCDPV
jgi:hypothetical protein